MITTAEKQHKPFTRIYFHQYVGEIVVCLAHLFVGHVKQSAVRSSFATTINFLGNTVGL